MEDLKAIFFVKDFTGDPGNIEKPDNANKPATAAESS